MAIWFHVVSADGAVYLEVVRFTALTAADGYTRYRLYLFTRFEVDAVTEPRFLNFQGRLGLRYAFCWGTVGTVSHARPVGDDPIRFILDPRLRLNRDVLNSATFIVANPIV